MRAARVVAVSCFLLGCQGTKTADSTDADPAAVRAEIEATTANFARWFTASAMDSAGTMVTEDYHWLPPNEPADSGRARWIASNKAMVATAKISQQITTSDVVVSGPLAVSRGHFTATITPRSPAGAKAIVDSGKYIWVWRMSDGRWLLSAASWNSDRRPPK